MMFKGDEGDAAMAERATGSICERSVYSRECFDGLYVMLDRSYDFV